jgi:hypothetical protein
VKRRWRLPQTTWLGLPFGIASERGLCVMTDAVMLLVGALYLGVGVLAAILVPLALIASGRRWSRSDQVLAIGAAVVLAAWFAVANTLVTSGGLQRGLGPVPSIAFVLLIPLALGFGLVQGVPRLSTTFLSLDLQPQLIAMQAYRIAGVGFLALVAVGELPAVFGIPAGAGDILVGATALGTAAAVRRGRVMSGVWWNVAGLLDLAIAVTLGIGTGPSALHFIPATPSSSLLTTAPFAVVPTFIVPLDIWLHCVSVRSLMARRADATVTSQLSTASAV